MIWSHLICRVVGCHWKDVLAPKVCPRVFCDGFVPVSQRREPGVTIRRIAEDFGISEACLQTWLRQVVVKAGGRRGTIAEESAEFRELRRVNRLLEQEK